MNEIYVHELIVFVFIPGRAQNLKIITIQSCWVTISDRHDLFFYVMLLDLYLFIFIVMWCYIACYTAVWMTGRNGMWGLTLYYYQSYNWIILTFWGEWWWPFDRKDCCRIGAGSSSLYSKRWRHKKGARSSRCLAFPVATCASLLSTS